MKALLARARLQVGAWNRRRKIDLACRVAEGSQSILFIGAGGDGNSWDNVIERSLVERLSPRLAVWASLDRTLEVPPGVFLVQCDGRALPFRDDAVDFAISNAVVEHVGDVRDQIAFVDEHDRCARLWFLTTPNRWFPVESHTLAVLRHYSPSWRREREEFTRLLSRTEFKDLMPEDTEVFGTWCAPTFQAIRGASTATRPG